jgi:hypothetical protein
LRSPIVLGHLRRRFARFKLCAHLLNLRWKAVHGALRNGERDVTQRVPKRAQKVEQQLSKIDNQQASIAELRATLAQ